MILAVLQARVSSTRLPGKVLKPILGSPMLWRQLERLEIVKQIDKLIVATSDMADDRQLVELCKDKGVDCFCGSLDDVLDRIYRAAKPYHPDHVVRLTGDCPLTEPTVIDEAIAFHLEGAFDYSGNGVEPTFPDGLDVEVMKSAALETAWKEATLASQREHVTPFLWQQPQRFRIGHFKSEIDMSHLRWTVDQAEDLEFVREVYEALYPVNPRFTLKDVLALLDRAPELSRICNGIDRNEGWKKSLAKESKEPRI